MLYIVGKLTKDTTIHDKWEKYSIDIPCGEWVVGMVADSGDEVNCYDYLEPYYTWFYLLGWTDSLPKHSYYEQYYVPINLANLNKRTFMCNINTLSLEHINILRKESKPEQIFCEIASTTWEDSRIKDEDE